MHNIILNTQQLINATINHKQHQTSVPHQLRIHATFNRVKSFSISSSLSKHNDSRNHPCIS